MASSLFKRGKLDGPVIGADTRHQVKPVFPDIHGDMKTELPSSLSVLVDQEATYGENTRSRRDEPPISRSKSNPNPKPIGLSTEDMPPLPNLKRVKSSTPSFKPNVASSHSTTSHHEANAPNDRSMRETDEDTRELRKKPSFLRSFSLRSKATSNHSPRPTIPPISTKDLQLPQRKEGQGDKDTARKDIETDKSLSRAVPPVIDLKSRHGGTAGPSRTHTPAPLPPIPKRKLPRALPSAPLLLPPPITLHLDPKLPGGEYDVGPYTASVSGRGMLSAVEREKKGFWRGLVGLERDKQGWMDSSGKEGRLVDDSKSASDESNANIDARGRTDPSLDSGQVKGTTMGRLDDASLVKSDGQRQNDPLVNPLEGSSSLGSNSTGSRTVSNDVDDLLAEKTTDQGLEIGPPVLGSNNDMNPVQEDDVKNEKETIFSLYSGERLSPNPHEEVDGDDSFDTVSGEQSMKSASRHMNQNNNVHDPILQLSDFEGSNEYNPSSGDNHDQTLPLPSPSSSIDSVLSPSTPIPLTYIDKIFDGLPFGPDVPAVSPSHIPSTLDPDLLDMIIHTEHPDDSSNSSNDQNEVEGIVRRNDSRPWTRLLCSGFWLITKTA